MGPCLLIPLLLLTGLYLTIVLRGIQFTKLGFTKLGYALWLALLKRKEAGAEGDISHYQALTTALAATIGTGNIAKGEQSGGPMFYPTAGIPGRFGLAAPVRARGARGTRVPPWQLANVRDAGPVGATKDTSLWIVLGCPRSSAAARPPLDAMRCS